MPPPVPASAAAGLDVGLGVGSVGQAEWDCAFERGEDGAWGEKCSSSLTRPGNFLVLPGLFVSRRFSESWELGGAAWLSTNIGSAGLFGRRYYFSESDRFRVGLHGEFGVWSIGMGVPLAYGVTDRVWVHTLPRISGGPLIFTPWSPFEAWELSLPVGFSYRASERLLFSVEGSAVWYENSALVVSEANQVRVFFAATWRRPARER